MYQTLWTHHHERINKQISFSLPLQPLNRSIQWRGLFTNFRYHLPWPTIGSIKCQYTFTFLLLLQDLVAQWLMCTNPPKVAYFKTSSYPSLFLGVLPYSKF